ncbi:MAG: heme exporter protein CcmB [Armatimonadota bacterium]|nr:heme exporter protein CcmB [Armatimonadota bacterium]
MRAFWVLLYKDLRIELRTREMLASMGLMTLIVLVLFSFAVGHRRDLVAAVVPGVLWVTLAFAAVAGLSRAYGIEQEREAGSGVLAAPVDRGWILLSKAATGFLAILAVQAAALPLLAVLFDYDLWPHLGRLAPVLLLGGAGLAIVGTLLAAMSAATRLREVLLPLLLFPLAMPLLVASLSATSKVLAGLPLAASVSEMRLIAAFDIILGAASVLLFEGVVEEGL